MRRTSCYPHFKGVHNVRATYRSEVIAVLRVEGRVTLQPSVPVRDDNFCVRVRWQRLYLVSISHGAAGEIIDKFEKGGDQ
jgi:hypothetical protein